MTTSNLQITLFGRFAVAAAGEPIRVGGPKQQALLAYLAYRAGTAVDREELVGLLWGDRFDKQARQSLRQALARLRRALEQAGAAPLETEGDAILFASDAAAIDIAEFRVQACGSDAASLESAGSLYGDLLKGLHIRQEGFDAWLDKERKTLAVQVGDVFSRLSACLADHGDWAKAIDAAERWAAFDPLNEAATRQVMHCRNGVGDKAGALKCYQTLSEQLWTELQTEPSSETQTFAEAIRTGPIGNGAAPAGIKLPAGKANTDAAPAPDKPSIAVLPFVNMSDDPGQEYFSDGIAEDIITALSRFHQFFVIARNSSFTYKGRAVDVKQVAQELGVQYVIEGSVRRAGNRVRITAQLIDAASDHHIWAERFDRKVAEIFAVQDDITERVAMAVAPELELMEMARAQRKNIPELGVWELVARANWHGSKLTEEDCGAAEDLLSKALKTEPGNARVHVALSRCYLVDGMYRWRRPQSESRALALEMGQKAVDLDKDDEFAQAQLGSALFVAKRHEDAIQRYRTAIKINPNFSFALGKLGGVFVFSRRHEEGLEHLQKATQLSPKVLMLPFFLFYIGIHHFMEERYDEARMLAEKALYENPNFPSGFRLLASAHGMLDNLAEARTAYEQFDQLAPGVTIAAMLESLPFAYEADAKRYVEGLRRAGMPEQ